MKRRILVCDVITFSMDRIAIFKNFFQCYKQ
jgi:hypothetical protein